MKKITLFDGGAAIVVILVAGFLVTAAQLPDGKHAVNKSIEQPLLRFEDKMCNLLKSCNGVRTQPTGSN